MFTFDVKYDNAIVDLGGHDELSRTGNTNGNDSTRISLSMRTVC